MSLKQKLDRSLNEKDVENVYRSELVRYDGLQITSPYGVDGLLENKSIRSLLEFKYNDNLKSKLSQCNVLVQCLYYLKKFENNGDKLPTTIFVGDIDECFAIHTNSIVKYLSSEIDWRVAPSEAHKKNVDLIHAMVRDVDILPFVYNVDDSFTIKTVIDKIKDLSDSIIRKVRITRHNIVTIFDYFDKNVLGGKVGLTTNEKANLFIQIVINPNENYLHPKKKNSLVTKGFGELFVNQNLFNSFFSHFEGDIYSPKEKEELTGLVDRLVEDTIRRNKGEFFTPTPFVDLAHKYISDVFGEDWKEKFVVWDCAWGTGNLTRDYKFNELYCSTIEQSDIDTADQMGYNPEGVKFRFDFLNDSDDLLPLGLYDAIHSGREILFFINPPYARSSGSDKVSNIDSGISDTLVGKDMKDEKWGSCSANLYAQFLYKISKFQERNKNVKIGIFCPPLFLTGGSYKSFRKKFFLNFNYEKGFLFEACHFSDVAKNWGISFTLFNNSVENKDMFDLNIVDFNNSFELEIKNNKEIYNMDNNLSLSKWMKSKTSSSKKIDTPQLTSSINIKNCSGDMINENSFGSFMNKMNSVYVNQINVAIFTSSSSKGNGGVSIDEFNYNNFCQTFTARKTILPTWINQKDEYLAPNEQHPLYEQFTYDSIVYSLFNNSSQQSSLRKVLYKDKLWDIKNEFFWLSKNDVMEMANDFNNQDVYSDAKTSDERFVYKKLFEEGIYDKLSPDAKEVLDLATELLNMSFMMREDFHNNKPEYHLNAWDAGYAQLKVLWKEYFKEDFNNFRNKYKELENRMRPLVYELGFLRK